MENNDFSVGRSGYSKWDRTDDKSDKKSGGKSSQDRVGEISNPLTKALSVEAPASHPGTSQKGKVKKQQDYSGIDNKVSGSVKGALRLNEISDLTRSISSKRGELRDLSDLPESRKTRHEKKKLKAEIRDEMKSLKEMDKTSYKNLKSEASKKRGFHPVATEEQVVSPWDKKMALSKEIPSYPEAKIAQAKTQLSRHQVGSRKYFPGGADDYYPQEYDSYRRTNVIIKNMKTATESLFALTQGGFYIGTLHQLSDTNKFLREKFFEYLNSISEEILPSVLTDIVVAYGKEPINFDGNEEPFLAVFTFLLEGNDAKDEIQTKINRAVENPRFMEGFAEKDRETARRLLSM